MNKNRPAPVERDWYDVPGLAELLGVSQEFIRQRTDRREIPFYKVGRLIRFGADDVAKWLEECRHDPMS